MKRFIVLLLLLSSLGCGNSVFIEYPGEHPDFELYCDALSREVWGTSPNTPLKIPFKGVRDTYLFTPKPDHWEEFDGTVHLTRISWNTDWINNAAILVDNLTIATLEDDGHWDTFPRVDLFPSIDVTDNGYLRLNAEMKANGWKPKGEQEIRANITVQLCGANSELIVQQYQ